MKFLLSVLLVAVWAVGCFAELQAASISGDDFIAAVNAERASKGAAALKPNTGLGSIAGYAASYYAKQDSKSRKNPDSWPSTKTAYPKSKRLSEFVIGHDNNDGTTASDDVTVWLGQGSWFVDRLTSTDAEDIGCATATNSKNHIYGVCEIGVPSTGHITKAPKAAKSPKTAKTKKTKGSSKNKTKVTKPKKSKGKKTSTKKSKPVKKPTLKPKTKKKTTHAAKTTKNKTAKTAKATKKPKAKATHKPKATKTPKPPKATHKPKVTKTKKPKVTHAPKKASGKKSGKKGRGIFGWF